MLRFVVKRILVGIPMLLILSIAVFWASNSISSPEAAIRNPRLRAEDLQRYREQLGLDDPAHEQYLKWLGNFVRGDLGQSLVSNREVWPYLKGALTNTLVLIVVAVGFSLLFGVIIGVISAYKQYSFFDYAATSVSFLGISMPVFWFALMAQIFFGLYLTNWLGMDGPVLPTAGISKPGSDGFDLWDRIRHLILPGMTLAVQLVAVYSRYVRSSMLEVLNADYMRTAKAKGLGPNRVLFRHGLRTALIPLTTQVAIDLGLLFSGLIVTEVVFQYPGMGIVLIDAIAVADYQIILPWLMITATAVILFNLIADLLYAVLDPRIRL